MKFYLTELDPLDRGIYHRELVVERADGRAWSFKWRWLPLVRWRYLSRAWQGYPPVGYVLASDWTGRERELIGWEWPMSARRVDLVVVEDRDEPEHNPPTDGGYARARAMQEYEPPTYRIDLNGFRRPVDRSGMATSLSPTYARANS